MASESWDHENEVSYLKNRSSPDKSGNNDLSLTCNFFAGTLHLQYLAASGFSQERSWMVAHYHVNIWAVLLLEAYYMDSKMKIYPEKW